MRSLGRWWSVSLLLLVAACGGDDDGGGGGGDAAPDSDAAPEADAAGDTVTVRLTIGDGETPAGVAVFSSDQDGEVVTESETDEDGEATIAVVPGGSVTFVHRDEKLGSVKIFTMRGVEPGDLIQWGTGNDDAGVNVDVEVPTNGGDTTGYKVVHPCGSTSGASNMLLVTHRPWCQRDPYTLLAISDDAEGVFTGFQFVDDVDVDTDPVVLEGDWEAVGTYGVTVTDIPETIDTVQLAERALREGTWVDIIRSGAVDQVDEAFTMQHLPEFGSKHELAVDLVDADASQSLREMGITLTGADVDVHAYDFLPALTGDITYDAGTRTLAFPDPGQSWDITDVNAYYVVDGDNVDWFVHGPGSENEEVLPELPAALADLAPSGAITVYLTLSETTLDIDWDDIRVQPERVRSNLWLYPDNDASTFRNTYVSDVIPE